MGGTITFVALFVHINIIGIKKPTQALKQWKAGGIVGGRIG